MRVLLLFVAGIIIGSLTASLPLPWCFLVVSACYPLGTLASRYDRALDASRKRV